jgi:hypothetical protein
MVCDPPGMTPLREPGAGTEVDELSDNVVAS